MKSKTPQKKNAFIAYQKIADLTGFDSYCFEVITISLVGHQQHVAAGYHDPF